MANPAGFHFDNFLPGFDFLKQFAQANPAAAMPTAAQWVTPTLDPVELDKRIQDLKSVQFWLDQNAKALSATIQALEVQRMTLSTLQSMNVGMADVAAAMTGKTAQQSSAQAEAKPSGRRPWQTCKNMPARLQPPLKKPPSPPPKKPAPRAPAKPLPPALAKPAASPAKTPLDETVPEWPCHASALADGC
jgi:hypothetical protein